MSARSILNGVIGDYLEKTDNELATPMTLMRRPGQPLDCSRLRQELLVSAKNCNNHGDGSRQALPICILLHGLVSDESCWSFPFTGSNTDDDDADSTIDAETTKKQKLDSTTSSTTSSGSNGNVDYGALLERDVPGLTALYLRYNTGSHISTNGQRFNELMEKLVVQLTTDNDDNDEQKLPPLKIILLCHSMGGLVARSATQYALRQAATWIYSTSRVIFLGTPHHGSYWECAGNIVTCALDYVPLSATKVVAKVAKLRSHGIQDLRYGYTLEEDWKKRQQDSSDDNSKASWSSRIRDNQKQPGNEQLLEWVSYHAVTGTVMADPKHPLNRLLGDGLVSKASAEGRSTQPEFALTFASKREFPGINHNALAYSRDVYVQLLEWIATTEELALAPKLDWSTLPSCATTDRVMCNEQTEPECPDNGFVVLDPHKGEEAMLVVNPEKKKTCSSHDKKEPCACFSINDGSSNNVGRFAKYRGATSLVQDAVDGGVSAVEQVQTEITDDIYRAIKYVTPSVATPIVTGVQSIQTGIVSGIYKSIRLVNYGTAETVKMSFQTIDSVETIGSKMKWFF